MPFSPSGASEPGALSEREQDEDADYVEAGDSDEDEEIFEETTPGRDLSKVEVAEEMYDKIENLLKTSLGRGKPLNLARQHVKIYYQMQAVLTLIQRGWTKKDTSNHVALAIFPSIDVMASSQKPVVQATTLSAPCCLMSNSVRSSLSLLTTLRKYVRVTDAKDGVERIVYPEVFGAESTLTVHVTTVRRWLILVGYRYSRIKKRVYVDGHERDDVREYRIWFLDQMATYERYMTWYTPDSNGILQPHPPALRPGEKEIIAPFHDESSFHGYDMPIMAGPRMVTCPSGRKVMVVSSWYQILFSNQPAPSY